MTPKEALQQAIEVLGSQSAVAGAAGPKVKTGHIYHWLNEAGEVPAKYCPGIERATREKDHERTVFCEWLCPSADWAAVRMQEGPVVVPPDDEPDDLPVSDEGASTEHAQAQDPSEHPGSREAVDPSAWPLQRENRVLPRREGPSNGER